MFLVISTIYSTAFVIQGTQFKLQFKKRGTDEWANHLIYVILTYDYRSLLRKLIRKLRISFTNENFRKKLKVLVAFLSTQKIGEQLGFLPLLFPQNNSIKTM